MFSPSFSGSVHLFRSVAYVRDIFQHWGCWSDFDVTHVPTLLNKGKLCFCYQYRFYVGGREGGKEGRLKNDTSVNTDLFKNKSQFSISRAHSHSTQTYNYSWCKKKKKNKNNTPNHTGPFYGFTKTLIPSVSHAEQMFQKPHPHTTASLKSPPIQKNQLTCKEKNLSQCGPCTTCFSSWSKETAFLSFSHLKCTSVSKLHTTLYAFSFQTVLTSFCASSLYALGNFKFPISCWELHSAKICTSTILLLHFSER